MNMKYGDLPSTRFALYVRHIANGHEKPNANSIANSNVSDIALASNIRIVFYHKCAANVRMILDVVAALCACATSAGC